MSLKLIGSNPAISPWPLRAWLLLRVLEVPFEEQVVDLLAPDKTQQLAKVSPSGRVPVLYDGETVVWETTAIIEYVAERFPELAIWPRERHARAHARSVAHEMHAGFAALRRNCVFDMARAPARIELDDAARADVARIVNIWTATRAKFGQGGRFLYGGFTAADAMYAPIVNRFETFQVEGVESAHGYMEAVTSLPAWKEWKARVQRYAGR